MALMELFTNVLWIMMALCAIAVVLMLVGINIGAEVYAILVVLALCMLGYSLNEFNAAQKDLRESTQQWKWGD